MYKDYNMTQLTLPMETSVLIPTNDISRHVNDIVETTSRLNSMNSDIIVANIRKVKAQRAENNQNYEKTISILFQ